MRLSVIGLMGFAATLGVAACSGHGGTPQTMGPPGTPPGDVNQCNPACPTGATTPPTTLDLNPDGFGYPNPEAGYGYEPRMGSTPGSVIQDFSFLGYPLAVVSKNLSTIKLSDYYDPCTKRYKLLHITMAAVWCQPCNMETDQLVSLKSTLATDKVVVIQALDDGSTPGIAATQNDLDGWISYHKSNFTEMLDPEHFNLGPFFPAAAIPWNANVDPRTMEILDSSVGLSQNGVIDDINQGLAELNATPSYPIPSTVNCSR